MSESAADDYGFTMHDFFLIKNTIHNISIIYIYYYYYLCEIFEKLSYSYKICYIYTLQTLLLEIIRTRMFIFLIFRSRSLYRFIGTDYAQICTI